MTEKLKMQTRDGVADNISWIAEKFPNCVTEKIDASTGEVKLAVDFDMLRQELSTEVVEGKDERYQFVWPDKKKAILLANAPINATLRPCREESVDFDNTQNLYIEGDNLDVLKCLKETYLRKVKMIYIDPPYNTGNDFVYNDDFAESTEVYMANSGQYDEQGNRLVANTESNGRFHTDWLNMMYPRLKVARDLLSEDGVIFISIDDNEVDNLKKICNEVFGEQGFYASIVWQKRTSPDARFNLGAAHDFIIVYTRNKDLLKNRLNKEPLSAQRASEYKNPDNDPRGPWASVDITGQTGHATSSQFYEITTKGGVIMRPPQGRCWAMAESTFKSLVADNRIWFGEDGNSRPRQKRFLSEASGVNAWTWWNNETVGHNQEGTKDFKDLFGTGDIFTNPKPIKLLLRILKLATNTDSIILDFFSGSATTAHAVMQLNAVDGGKRKFIMVQLPETTDEKSEAYKAGYKNICEIGKERIRRAANKIKEETGADIDYGFRVLKLDSSNMLDVYYAPSEIDQESVLDFKDNVKSGRTDEDLLFQTMLELGATLDSKIEKIEANKKSIYNVADGFIVASFDNEVTDDVVKAIAKMQPQYAVLRDSSLADDSTATNFEQIFKTYSPTTTCKIL